MSADARVVIHLLTLKCGPPLDKESSREEIKLAERMASILKDFEARQLEVDEYEQLEVVGEEEEDWDPQDKLMEDSAKAKRVFLLYEGWRFSQYYPFPPFRLTPETFSSLVGFDALSLPREELKLKTEVELYF
ncbi:unnamed protein product [Heligmosomoides polygyrus]|uniref:RWD domain-containing protein n=1 Tax=Heligmosomoides polygyrus TaxID=6339 RepID=A0A183G9A2_HELPZ|nr:unnamed protein product [Heligmosomoides polygyrus]